MRKLLSEQELLNLLKDIESDRVERTTSTKDTGKFCEAVCAFCNDFPNHRLPGYLLVGVDDKGNLSGLTVTDQLLQNLAAIRSDGNVQPMPAMTVQKYSTEGGEVAVVEVFASDLPPVRYKGRIWIRVGPRRAIANETEERLLSERRASTFKTFDAAPCPECNLDDLMQDLFLFTYRKNAIAAEEIAANNRDIKMQLASLRFYDLSKNCPTIAGVLLFAKDPLRFLPGAYVQFVRYAGSRLSDEIENELTFSGDLLTVLRELNSFVNTQNRIRPEPGDSFREKLIYDYPLIAIKEFIMNAIMHRFYNSTAPIRFYWFMDRIEIQNPGGLYGEANPANFPAQNSYRNPVIAEAMKVLGYVNKHGRGVFRAQESLEKNGNPPAEFQFETSYFLVTLRGKK